ncbi:hypothetical protein FDECE_19 [Fusarium decemcellulare]|nr:hypothetical protein FDECE_19 [Fusarium decemcellulare]
MEVALTFGSLGDIIQLCQLAIQLGRAVGVGCGAVGESAKEYQELHGDLDFFVRILIQVKTNFSRLPSSYTNICATLLARADEVHKLVSESRASQEDMLRLMRQQRKASDEQVRKLNEVNQLLVRQGNSSRSILGAAGEALSAIVEVKDLLVQVSKDIINIHIVFNSMYLRSMDPTKELPVIIEDALGRHVPIPAEWLGSLEWEVLYALLSGHFKGQNGHDKVQRREYALEESASGSDLNPERPLHLFLRRGMRINMSMLCAERCHSSVPKV